MFKEPISLFVVALAFVLVTHPASAADAPKPLRILLIAGGCCHDYAQQKEILKKGIEARVNAEVDMIFVADDSTHPRLPIYGHPNYAKGYDVVIHDECAADVNDPAIVEGVLKPHRDGIPGVNLHCGMHSYRIGNPNDPVTPGTAHGLWFEYLGLQSSGHGAQLPISLSFIDPDSPITQGLTDWTTVNEELYNNVKAFNGAHPLARGKQGKSDFVVVWTNLYQGKTRVFSTTIGHNNATVEDPRYLDLVTRGVLWACGKLGEDGKPLPGYAK
jgi:Trehalose utilisation